MPRPLNPLQFNEPQQLTESKQLMVEGKDALEFFRQFLKELNLTDVQIHNFNSVSEFPIFLRQFTISPNFKQIPVTSLGIIRDAEQDATGARDSICKALEKAGLPLPGKSITKGNDCKTDVFILPDGKSSGMIETLILRAVEKEPAFQCVDKYLECVTAITGVEPRPKDKARFLTFLASKPDIKPLTGYAAKKGYLKFESDAYTPLKQFLLNLFN